MYTPHLIPVFAFVLLITACSDDKTSASATKNIPATKETVATEKVKATVDLAAGKKMYATRCAACHGDTGLGDGAGGVAMTPKPKDFSDVAWQDATTDESIRKAILVGGMGVGKSPLMPAQSDLKNKPDQVNNLVALIRSFKK
ncbi:MAG: cytochrome c [Deltaproteobacteria bacterium]|nr:cytochrome c [Deltaproteobacteria bacterium]